MTQILKASLSEELGRNQNVAKRLSQKHHIESIAETFINAPDIYHAAAIMRQ